MDGRPRSRGGVPSRARARVPVRRAPRASSGRSRTASGAFSACRSRAASVKRSDTREVCSRPHDATGRGHRAPAGAPPARHRQPAGERVAGGRAAARLPRGERRRMPSSTPRVPERANLVARIPGGDGPSLAFLCHTDTVLADPAEWDRDPWSGDLVDGEVWGRGALDMKDRSPRRPSRSPRSRARASCPPAISCFIATADEEVGGTMATASCGSVRRTRMRCGATTRSTRAAASASLLGGAPVYLCATAEKMSAPFIVRVYGRSGHASMPGHRRQRARQVRALPRGTRRLRAAAGADPGGEGLPRGGARRGAAARRGARTSRSSASDAPRARRASPRVHAVADDDRRVPSAERRSPRCARSRSTAGCCPRRRPRTSSP